MPGKHAPRPNYPDNQETQRNRVKGRGGRERDRERQPEREKVREERNTTDVDAHLELRQRRQNMVCSPALPLRGSSNAPVLLTGRNKGGGDAGKQGREGTIHLR